MASPHLTEIFDDVRLFVEPCMFREPRKVTAELQRTSHLEHARGSYLVVRGPFKDIEDVYVKLSSMEKNTKTNTEREKRNNLNHHTSPELTPARSTQVESVEIDGAVIHYIKEKHAAEIEQIQRTGVDVQIGKRRVVFCPLNTESRILARLARERFVTFYQKIATALQTRTHYLNATQRKTLVTKFPELLHSIGPDKHEVTLTGNYFDLERFEQFLQSSPRTSSHKQNSHTDKVSGSPSSPLVLQKEEICSICLEPLVKLQIATLEKCKHSFCKDCLKRAFDIKPVCPTCGVIYGALKGTQPKSGTMRTTVSAHPLAGYKKCGTIAIHYYFPNGTQGDEHPNPGQPYEGGSRFAYLPDSPEGRKVLQLLIRAFEQRLTFTIGRSSTTGKNNVVTWNDIHHKTSRDGGPTCYGYPDPDYLKRVQEELKVKGIY